MLNGILIAFLISLIGTISLEFNLLSKDFSKYLKEWYNNLKWGIPVAMVLAYVGMPPLVFPDILVPIFIVLGINSIYTIARLLTGVGNTGVFVVNKNIVKKFKVPFSILVIILALWMFTSIYPIVKAADLNQVPQVTISQDKISAIDPAHIRQVPLEFARWKADKVVGELGNKVGVGRLTVQLYKDRVVWVAPLEFTNIFKWLKFKTSPGYVVVDAENPDAQVIKVDTKEMKYINSAYLQSNLFRKVYQKYPFHRLKEVTFEIDENGEPWWTFSAVKPSLWNTGEKVFGVILLNAETGETQFYESPPEWVDRVFPEYVAENYNFWYGAYKHGYINTLFAQKDMHLPTGNRFGQPDVFAVRSGENLVWFTGHTSPSNQDQSLVGYSTIDTRTGDFVFYSNVSGFYNEQAAISNANSAVSNFQGYRGAQPVFYNLLGELTWVIPILSSNSKLQRIALIHASTGNVVLGETLEEALDEYKVWIRKNIGSVITDDNLIYVEGIVERINDDLLLIDDLDEVFNLEFIATIEKRLTKEGDSVKIGYGTKDLMVKVIEVKEFDNLEFNLE
jgi:hypothetical protein